jgi:hypothetical protein
MGRTYGKTKRSIGKRTNSTSTDNGALKIKMRGKDGAPLSMQELRDGLYEAAHRLKAFEGSHRIKWATLYLQLIDEDGNEVVPPGGGEWEIYPYKCAADEAKTP